MKQTDWCFICGKERRRREKEWQNWIETENTRTHKSTVMHSADFDPEIPNPNKV